VAKSSPINCFREGVWEVLILSSLSIGAIWSRGSSIRIRTQSANLPGRHLRCYKTTPADNEPDFHDYKTVAAITDVPFYLANKHYSWERGTNENTNGLIRQYLLKGADLKFLSQRRCNQIARMLNERPRKRHGNRIPDDVIQQMNPGMPFTLELKYALVL
jgi:IS30 family transposase